MILDPKVYEKAAHDTALLMTADLRNKAVNDGWDPEVAKAMRVEFTEDGHIVRIAKNHQESAHKHEYGSEGTPPTASIRKYSNKIDSKEHLFLSRLKHHAEGTKE